MENHPFITFTITFPFGCHFYKIQFKIQTNTRELTKLSPCPSCSSLGGSMNDVREGNELEASCQLARGVLEWPVPGGWRPSWEDPAVRDADEDRGGGLGSLLDHGSCDAEVPLPHSFHALQVSAVVLSVTSSLIGTGWSAGWVYWMVDTNITQYHLYVESKKWYKWTYLQSRHRLWKQTHGYQNGNLGWKWII